MFIISSFLVVASFLFPQLAFLSWISLVPCFIFVNETKRGFIAGQIVGTLSYVGILYWIIPTFIVAGEGILLGILSLLLLSAYLGLYFAFFFYTVAKKKISLLDIIFYPSLWAGLEYARTHLLTGFPWALLAYTQWKNLPLIQISDITGPYGVSFYICMVNYFISDLYCYLFRYNTSAEIHRKKLFLNVSATAIITILIFGYGIKKINEKTTNSEKKTIEVAILQGNIDQYKKWNAEYKNEIIYTYTQLACNFWKKDLVIWPESSVPGYLRYEPDLYKWIQKMAHITSSYHLVGSVDYDNKTGKVYNTAFLISPDGRILQRYDKLHLVLFGETVPLRPILSKIFTTLNEFGEITPGNDYIVFRENEKFSFSAPICFESIFPSLIRNFRRGGAEVIINITNDAWFLRTAAPLQHFVNNVFRAVENRCYVICSANTGISGIVDKYGRILKMTKIFETTSIEATLLLDSPGRKALTFYTLHGDVFAISCCIVVIFIFCIEKIFTK
jgi:apolipoprotein N-acyltransferase